MSETLFDGVVPAPGGGVVSREEIREYVGFLSDFNKDGILRLDQLRTLLMIHRRYSGAVTLLLGENGQLVYEAGQYLIHDGRRGHARFATYGEAVAFTSGVGTSVQGVIQASVELGRFGNDRQVQESALEVANRSFTQQDYDSLPSLIAGNYSSVNSGFLS